MSILVVGSVAFDTIHNHLGTHPKVLGGSATYASLAAAPYAPTQLVGVVGRDFPEDAIELMRRKRIGLDGLEVADGETFHWEGRYTDDLTSRVSISTELNVFADFEPKVPEEARSVPYVLLGNIHPTLQMQVLDQLDSPKLVIADTMNFWIEGTPNELAEMLKRIDVLVINEDEARQLSGLYNIVKAAEKLRAAGPSTVIIKRGEYGALLFRAGELFHAPALPLREVQDPTGAGDTFAGAFLGFVASRDATDEETLRQAVVHGSAVASYCVEGMSVSGLVDIKKQDIETRVDLFRRLIHIPTNPVH